MTAWKHSRAFMDWRDHFLSFRESMSGGLAEGLPSLPDRQQRGSPRPVPPSPPLSPAHMAPQSRIPSEYATRGSSVPQVIVLRGDTARSALVQPLKEGVLWHLSPRRMLSEPIWIRNRRFSGIGTRRDTPAPRLDGRETVSECGAIAAPLIGRWLRALSTEPKAKNAATSCSGSFSRCESCCQ